jgi:hypothetical protein
VADRRGFNSLYSGAKFPRYSINTPAFSVFKTTNWGIDVGLHNVGIEVIKQAQLNSSLSRIADNSLRDLITASSSWKGLGDGLIRQMQVQPVGRLTPVIVSPSIMAITGVRSLLPGLIENMVRGLPSWLDMTRGVFPANIIQADVDFELDELKTWMLTEGLPVAWVPRPSTIEALHQTKSASGRRQVYGRRWKSILTDCEDLLADMSSPEVAPFVAFALESIAGIRDGHQELAQAFTANTLDTAVTRFMSSAQQKLVIKKRTRQDPDTFASRQFFAYAQLQGVYEPFWVNNGDKIPGTFNRNGSVHAVSRRQYSRVNSVLGIAHLTSYLWFVDTTLRRASQRN